MNKVPIAQPIIGEEERAAVLKVLGSGNLVQGDKVREFEEAFAAYCGTEYAVAVSSGSVALYLALLAHGVGPGTEVITTPFSFISTATAIMHCGATPRFVDIERTTFTLDPEKVEEAITPNTRAILPVDLYGHPARLDELQELCDQYGLSLIEDACQAHSSIYKGKKIGSLATTCFSFYGSKNMTTAGEGGMVTTDDDILAYFIRQWRQHGMAQGLVGFNYRMTEIQAAIGCEQLKKLDAMNARRRVNASLLTEKLGDLVVCPTERENCTHAWYLYTIRTDRRDEIKKALNEAGIDARVYYPRPIYDEPCCTEYGIGCPVTEMLCKQVLSLPVHPAVTEEDIDRMVEVIRCVLE